MKRYVLGVDESGQGKNTIWVGTVSTDLSMADQVPFVDYDERRPRSIGDVLGPHEDFRFIQMPRRFGLPDQQTRRLKRYIAVLMVVELMKHFMEIYGEAPVQTYVDGVVHEPRVATINALVSPGDPLQIKGIPEADGTRPVVMASDIIARNLYHSRREHQAARIRVARRAERQDEHVSSSGHWAGEPYASRLLRPDFPTAYRPFLERSVNNAFLSLGR